MVQWPLVMGLISFLVKEINNGNGHKILLSKYKYCSLSPPTLGAKSVTGASCQRSSDAVYLKIAVDQKEIQPFD